MLTPNAQREALRKLVEIVLETIEAGGELGAPSGVLYAGLMHLGMRLDQYETLINSLKEVGLVTESAHLLKLTDVGRAKIKEGK